MNKRGQEKAIFGNHGQRERNSSIRQGAEGKEGGYMSTVTGKEMNGG